MPRNYFLSMIKNLRQHEEIMLYGNILKVAENEETGVIDFLKHDYYREALAYPGSAPQFDPQAALWAAKTVYTSAQLMLYRENKESDLPQLLPYFTGELNASTILSADLCLRFLPDMLSQLKVIDNEDTLIAILEHILVLWHYSGIKYSLDAGKLDFTAILADPCLHQLYIDRIIGNKNLQLAMHHACKSKVQASLGNFGHEYWNEFKLATTSHE